MRKLSGSLIREFHIFLIVSLTALVAASPQALAQLRADGRTLEVTTDRVHAVFTGGDVTQIDNLLTGESVAEQTEGPAVAKLIRANGETEEMAEYVWGIGDYNGLAYASLAKSEGLSPAKMDVWIDPVLGQIVVRTAAAVESGGLRGVRWGLRSLDIVNHQLILPVLGGILFDATRPPPPDFTATSETRWEAPFLMLASRNGGMVVFNEKHQAPYRSITVPNSGGGKFSLAVETTALGPWGAASSIDPVEWRLDCFSGTWMDGADVYRRATTDWSEPPLPAGANWVRNIRTVIIFGGGLLDLPKLAGLTDPKQTLLYLPNWRISGYDRNYPDYSPLPELQPFMERARQLGFHVMLHVNPFGLSSYHPEYSRFERFQVRDPLSLQLQGWRWDRPESEPTRFAYINPASSEWRSLFINSLRPALALLRPDALHLDQTGLAVNDGNGLIESQTAVEGMVQLHRELSAEFPATLLGGESVYDQLAPLQWFAQRWSAAKAGVHASAHPLSSYLLGSRFKVYGYLGMPTPESSEYLTYFRQYERQAIIPTIAVHGEIDSPAPDLSRAFRVAQTFQQNALDVVWTPDSSGDRITYQGKANATFSSLGTLQRLDVGGKPIYERISGVSTVRSPLLIRNWPAFDAQDYFGLDPEVEYWLDPGSREVTAPHFSRLPDGTVLTSETFHTPDGSMLAVRPSRESIFDAIASAGLSKIGTNNGADGPLFGSAAVSTTTIRVGGDPRDALVVHPPGGPASSYVEYSVKLPAGGTIALSFAAGVADGAQRSEPVAFEIRADDLPLWSQEIGLGRWQEVTLDLSRFAGMAIRMRFLTQARNSNYAWASFATPVIFQFGSTDPLRILVAAPGKGEVVVPAPSQASFSGGQVEVSNIPAEGKTPLFYRPFPAFSPGQSLIDLAFTNLQVVEKNMPVPGSVYGSGTIGRASSGGVTRTRAISAHPPNRGATYLVWSGQLPDRPMQLTIGAGLQDGNRSEGVLFRVLINGQLAWEEYRPGASQGWTFTQVDLYKYKGSPVMIQLVTDSAGLNFFDWAYWTDLTLN